MNTLLRDYYGKSRLTAWQILKNPMLFLAFGFGSGLSRYMPGTFGTIAAIPLYLALQYTDSRVYLLVTICSVLGGIYICEQAARKLQVHDFGGIVWDEIAGLLITLTGLPYSWQMLLSGFCLFRLLDIFKPWPISWLDKNINGGLGIMLDDVVAGLLAAGLLRIWF
ncbi:phosphatidylglycerophosphatase A [Methylomonas paludis]|uniref:Phosphatidylglycerophosphatase A n=1 Tax=Methylomonas paludis TaxID=1173101 RepID=A0A975MM69_9GAMM|nr:phosphatidylglycerophosphatase A [Methylomonas paludis]QWF70362.1 phosphatidylglycerophosphatase A [Methylomonas paludis]